MTTHLLPRITASQAASNGTHDASLAFWSIGVIRCVGVVSWHLASGVYIASLMLGRIILVLAIALVLLAVLLTLTILLCRGTIAASRVWRCGGTARKNLSLSF
jgi:hypothetical protein